MANDNKLEKLSDQELIEVFNREVGNPGWTSSRSKHLSALHEEFEQRGFDYTSIGGTISLSFKRKIKLAGKKILID